MRQTDPKWVVVRSVKRLLEKAGPGTRLDLGEEQVLVTDLLSGLVAGLARALRHGSNLHLAPGEPLEAMIGVPAHANSNQRFLTVEAFRAAGFHVLGILNEPSAASIEFGHRQRQAKSSRGTILVYDLGGGTFDASLVTIDEDVHHVMASEGIPSIGGDDFDQALCDLALELAGIEESAIDALPASSWFQLLDECRTKKESLNPNSRRVTIELDCANPDWPSVQVPIAEFYERARPLVEETLRLSEELMAAVPPAQFEALYITGGGSELPLVARVLRERFGRRVRRSAYTRSATAIGLAIQAAQPDTYRLSERLGRHFGVWREADNGTRIVFDPLFEKGTSLPSPGQPPITRRRTYRPAHNVGHFRFLECSHRTCDGTPSGEITFWDEIRFPFEEALQSESDLTRVAVLHSDPAGRSDIEEVYECDAGGAITASVANLSTGYRRRFELGRWSQQSETVRPGKRARATRV